MLAAEACYGKAGLGKSLAERSEAGLGYWLNAFIQDIQSCQLAAEACFGKAGHKKRRLSRAWKLKWDIRRDNIKYFAANFELTYKHIMFALQDDEVHLYENPGSDSPGWWDP